MILTSRYFQSPQSQMTPVAGSGTERWTVTVASWAPDCQTMTSCLRLKCTSMMTTPPKLGPQFVPTQGRVRETSLDVQKSPSITSYSWVLALRLHYAGKCNFSFGDYKIHVPKRKKTHDLIIKKAKLAFCGNFLYVKSCAICMKYNLSAGKNQVERKKSQMLNTNFSPQRKGERLRNSLSYPV